MKIITFYLPQYHTIPENDEWWGKGFTEWTNLKKGEPLFEGHYQPRIPLNNNYYNLLDNKVKEWQVKIAKENGVYGFCFYHYWFDGHMLLEKPMEQYVQDQECNLHFCICWANENWTKAWVSNQNTNLIVQRYGEREQWIEHFNYLLPFFKDRRYICNDGKPLMVIYRPELIECLNDMLDCWTECAKENGFLGIDFAYQHVDFDKIKNRDDSRFRYAIEYQPGYGLNDLDSNFVNSLKRTKQKLNHFLQKNLNITLDVSSIKSEKNALAKYSYDEVWEKILQRTPLSEKYIPGAFVDWDNTPRRGNRGKVFLGATPQKFEKYMEQLIIRSRQIYNKDMIFVFAWNEWSEGGYLEPDEKFGYGYLKAIKEALLATNEFPDTNI